MVTPTVQSNSVEARDPSLSLRFFGPISSSASNPDPEKELGFRPSLTGSSGGYFYWKVEVKLRLPVAVELAETVTVTWSVRPEAMEALVIDADGVGFVASL